MIESALWHPRHWLTWLGVGALRLATLLPLPVLWFLGAMLGMLLYAVHIPRRRIVATNLALCFPALTTRQRTRLARQHFRALGQGLFDVGIAWWASRARLHRLVRVCNSEHLERARAQGRGIILLAPHFVALEIGGLYISSVQAGSTMFKDTRNNAVINALFRSRRQRFGAIAIEYAQGLKPAVRSLKRGHAFYYLPDQDLGSELSVFAPFFGVPTATVPALGTLVRLSGAVVLPCVTRQLPFGGGYELSFASPLENFPSGDALSDAAQMNAAIESAVRALPAQYFWVHKRFKTRPPGAPRVY